MDQIKLNTLRIKLLCRFLDQGGGSLAELHEWINEQLALADQDSIGVRTLQSLIEMLRKGDFVHSRFDLDKKQRYKLFKVTYREKIYQWAEDSLKPEFGDLEDDERYTLPFIIGLLKKYESIPAVRKILDTIPETFGITEAEMSLSSVIYHTGAMLHQEGKSKYDYAADVIQTTIKILGHISRKEMIEFMYAPVSIQSESLKAKKYHRVAPMQIRFYDELYYLTAIDIEHKRIVNFRIDQIVNLKVDPALDEEDQVLHFDAAELEKKYKLTNHFKHVLGIWNHQPDEKAYEIRIQFKSWAAAYISKLKFHPTQKTINIDPTNNSITISMELKLGKEAYAGQPANERSPELNFLLGRFGKYAEVVGWKER